MWKLGISVYILSWVRKHIFILRLRIKVASQRQNSKFQSKADFMTLEKTLLNLKEIIKGKG